MIQKRMSFKLSLAILLVQCGMQAATADPVNELVVHEWGTFTSLQGSDGGVQPGMHHEEERLPDFVYSRDPMTEIPEENQFCKGILCDQFKPSAPIPLKVTQKMETPVIYFHSPEPMHISVEIDFPDGIMSQYYPRPYLVSPRVGSLMGLFGGHARFEVDLVKHPLLLPEVSPKSVYAPSREVNADFIRSGKDHEKLIFYRGLGAFETQLQATSSEVGLTLSNLSEKESIPGALLLNITEKNGVRVGALMEIGAIGPAQKRVIDTPFLNGFLGQTRPLGQVVGMATLALRELLMAQGLYRDEADAMINTWKESYFKSDGLRVLHILPRSETDAILPLKIKPAPQSLARVLVGRTEILLAREEKQLLEEIRNQSNFNPKSLGRFAEPKLHRLLSLATETSVKEKILKMIRSLN